LFFIKVTQTPGNMIFNHVGSIVRSVPAVSPGMVVIICIDTAFQSGLQNNPLSFHKFLDYNAKFI